MANDYWQIFWQGRAIKEDDPTGAIAKMSDARDMALSADDKVAVLEMNHWILQTMIFHAQDFRHAYDLAVQTASEARKPDYAQTTTRICVYQDLILTYLGMDPLGHETLIESAVEHMLGQVTPMLQCRFCLQDLRVEFEMTRERWDDAQTTAHEYLAMSEGTYHRYHHGVIANSQLCQIAYYRGDWAEMRDYAQLVAEATRTNKNLIYHYCVALAALALAHKKLGDPSEVYTRYYRQATSKAGSTGTLMLDTYYDCLVDYHLLDGRLKSALNLRERQLKGLLDKGRTYWEARCRVEIIRLKKQMGLVFASDLADLESLMPKLKDPTPVQRRLAEALEE